MKTMMSLDGARIIRVSDEEASRIYHEGGFRYTTKSKWKEQVRDVGKTEETSTISSNSSKKTHNKISKATKRHLRKQNK